MKIALHLRVNVVAMSNTEPEIESFSQSDFVSQLEKSGPGEEMPLESQRGRHCKLKYKPRKFSSKAALLVLFWNTQFNTMFGLLDNFYTLFHLNEDPGLLERIATYVLPFVLLLLTGLLYGVLADVYLGHY